MGYEWNWSVFLQAANAKETYFDWILTGMWVTIKMSVLGLLIALVLGSVLGVMRTLNNRFLSGIAATYVELVRNVPLIVQLFMWYYVAPKFLPESWRMWLFAQSPETASFITAVFGLGIFTAARVCELVRTGVNALPRGLKNAGLAVGFTLPQTYRFVLLPIAYRMIIPPLTSETMSIVKNSALAATIGVIDLFARTRQLTEYTARQYESFIAIILCYFLINIAIVIGMSALEKRVRLPGMVGN
jgi:glutamate/aspartate transport system permease protein